MLCFSAAALLFAESCTKDHTLKTNGTSAITPIQKTNSLISNYGTFTIQCVTGSKFIEVAGTTNQGTKLFDGTKLEQWQASINGLGQTDRWQKWQISKAANGYYTIMNLNSGKYIDVPGSTTVSGTVLQQYRGNLTDAQYWAFTAVGSNYKITNKANGLAITNHASSTANGTTITQETYTGANNQLWTMNAIAADSYRDDAVVGFFQRTTGSDAFDGGASVPLTWSSNNGKVLWVTNDTFYSQVNGSGEFSCGLIFPYRNSALIQPASKSWDPSLTSNITSPDGVQIFHTTTSGALLWPGAGIEIGQHVYVHNIEVPNGSLGATNQFLCDITQSTTTSIGAVNKLTVPNMSGQTAVTYSLGMVKPGDGFVYAYGTGGFIGAGVYVARFATGSPTSWTFWNGTTWASTPTNATAAQVASGPANNNTVGYVNGKYVLIEMDFGFSCDASSRNVYSLTSTSPTGPFTNKQTVYTLADYKQGHTPVFYNPCIHAEFNNGHNELLIGYAVNFYSKNDGTGAKCLTDCSNPDGSEDPNDYRIKGVRIPYSLIGL